MQNLRIILIFVLFLSFSTINAQLTVGWLGNIGGQDNDFGYSIAVDSNKNVFVAGQFRGNVSFDPNSSVYDFT